MKRDLSRRILLRFSNYSVFTFRDLRLQFKDEVTEANLLRILSYLKKSGRIYGVRKGIYTTKKDSMVSGFAFKPFYYGMASALTIRELWDQNSRPEIITTRHVRASEMKIFGEEGNRIFVHHIPMKYFFGFDMLEYGKIKVPVSDPEKTLIDLFYYKTRLSIKNYGGLLKKIDIERLMEYLRRYDKHTKTTVLNFIKRFKQPAEAGKLDNPY
ncbi:MAG TPA: hypothetical protein VL945_02755 [Candidatus Saccharimonadales bacterium]|nr:hypothetical protein [Candidatus Saccharimonadales bacterium]